MDEVEEDIHQRHKEEQKKLNAEIQALKHSVPKGDKKRKKQVTSEIALLLAQLEERQAKELAAVGNNTNANESDVNSNGIESLSITETNQHAAPQPKISKAQKRREKKEAEERARQKRIEEDDQENVSHARNIEAALFDKLLKERGLKIHEINPDGNCMYNAVIVKLHGNTSEDSLNNLREKTSDYMLGHMDEFLPFTVNNETGDMLSTDEYEKYCIDIKKTNCWGGQLELRAISQIRQMPIEIYQAQAPTLLVGEEFQGDPIRLSYHRHQYGLGEHYNALLVDNDT